MQELFQTTQLLYAIADDDIWNMDEKGVMKGVGDNSRIIIPRNDPHANSIQPGNREWVSIIEAISAGGISIPPYVIFKGQRIRKSWFNDKIDPKIKVRVSPNGWTDHDIAVEWIRHFGEYTAPRTAGKYRLLILDGHSSHVSLRFVEYCDQHKIIPLCLPPHWTHVLQPLDVGIFSALAKAYKALVSRDALFGAQRINNLQFLLIYQQARKTIVKNIPGAWRGAGLLPFNPDRVLNAFRAKTPPTASITDSQGRRIEIQLTGHLADKVNNYVEELLQVLSLLYKKALLWFNKLI